VKFQLNNDQSINLIRSYEIGVIRIDETDFSSAVIVTPQSLNSLELTAISQLAASHFESLLDFKPELVILGTGPTQVFPDFALSQCLANRQIGLEVMNSSAASRTYNVLASDGRKVVALILP
jgi:uncharacterized protein